MHHQLLSAGAGDLSSGTLHTAYVVTWPLLWRALKQHIPSHPFGNQKLTAVTPERDMKRIPLR